MIFLLFPFFFQFIPCINLIYFFILILYEFSNFKEFLMSAIVHLTSNKKGELEKFLSSFYNTSFSLFDDLKWEKKYANPVEIAEIIGTFIDNCDVFDIHIWISIDKNVFIHVDEENADEIIKYLYERFPY